MPILTDIPCPTLPPSPPQQNAPAGYRGRHIVFGGLALVHYRKTSSRLQQPRWGFMHVYIPRYFWVGGIKASVPFADSLGSVTIGGLVGDFCGERGMLPCSGTSRTFGPHPIRLARKNKINNVIIIHLAFISILPIANLLHYYKDRLLYLPHQDETYGQMVPPLDY